MKNRLYLDIAKERKIESLQKQEKKLLENLKGGQRSLNDIKEDLQIMTGTYQRIKAIGTMRRQILFLEERTVMIQKTFEGVSTHFHEIEPTIKNLCFGLYKLNSEQASEFNSFFKRLVGDLNSFQHQVDRNVRVS